MTYFRLRAEPDISRQWIVDEIVDSADTLLHPFDSDPTQLRGTLSAEVARAGIQLPWSENVFGVPVAESRLASAMRMLAPSELVMLPLNLKATGTYCAVMLTRKLECLDTQRSRYDVYTEDDQRPDFLGQPKTMIRLRIVPAAVPSAAHMFRVSTYEMAIVVSAKMRDVMIATGCRGASFEDVTS